MRISLLLGIAAAVAATIVSYLANVDQIGRFDAATVYLSIARVALYVGLAVGGCSFAIRCGGVPERIAGTTIIATLIADPLLHLVMPATFDRVDPTHLLIDLVRFAIFLALSLQANRYWPICFAALQLLALAAHPAKAMEVTIHPVIYAIGAVMWSYGLLVLLILATFHHYRLIARGATRASWSGSLRRWGSTTR